MLNLPKIRAFMTFYLLKTYLRFTQNLPWKYQELMDTPNYDIRLDRHDCMLKPHFHVRQDVKEPLPVCMYVCLYVCMSHNQIIRLNEMLSRQSRHKTQVPRMRIKPKTPKCHDYPKVGDCVGKCCGQTDRQTYIQTDIHTYSYFIYIDSDS